MAETTIYDAYGRPARFDRKTIPQPDVWEDWRIPPTRRSQGITPETITGIFREADEGFPARQSELFDDALLKDGKIVGMCRNRLQAPAGLTWELEAATDDAADKRVVEWLEPKLQQLGMRSVLKRLMRAVVHGFGAEQILWSVVGSEVEVKGLKKWPTRYLLPDTEGAITRYATNDEPMGTDMPLGKFIVHTPSEIDDDPVSAGIGRTATWYWFFKNWGLKAWLMYLEIYGQPFRWATFPMGATTDDKNEAYQSLLKMGREAVALLPESFQVNIQDMAHKGGADLYEKLKVACDEELAILFLGQTLTTSIGETGGAHAAAKVHDDVRQDIIEADAAVLSETLTRDLITPWVRFQFSRDADVPQFRIQATPPEDLKANSEVHKTLFVDMGLPVARSFLYEHYNVPAPAKGDDLLVAPPATTKPADDAAATATVAAAQRATGGDPPSELPRPEGASPSADFPSWMI